METAAIHPEKPCGATPVVIQLVPMSVVCNMPSIAPKLPFQRAKPIPFFQFAAKN